MLLGEHKSLYTNKILWHFVLTLPCARTDQSVSQADPSALTHQQNFSSVAAVGWSSSVPSLLPGAAWGDFAVASSGTAAKHPQHSNILMSFLAWLGFFLGACLVPGSFIQARANVFVLGKISL